MTDEEFIKDKALKVEKLFDLYPIENLQPVEVREEMRDGLGRMYAHKGSRAYLENAIKIAIRNQAIATTSVEIAYYKSRMDTLLQLLSKGEQMYKTVQATKEINALKRRKE